MNLLNIKPNYYIQRIEDVETNEEMAEILILFLLENDYELLFGFYDEEIDEEFREKFFQKIKHRVENWEHPYRAIPNEWINWVLITETKDIIELLHYEWMFTCVVKKKEDLISGGIFTIAFVEEIDWYTLCVYDGKGLFEREILDKIKTKYKLNILSTQK